MWDTLAHSTLTKNFLKFFPENFPLKFFRKNFPKKFSKIFPKNFPRDFPPKFSARISQKNPREKYAIINGVPRVCAFVGNFSFPFGPKQTERKFTTNKE